MIIFEQFFTSSSGKELSAGVCEANYLDLYSLLSRYPDTFTLKRNGKDSLSVSYRDQRIFILGEETALDQLENMMVANLKVDIITPYQEGFDSGFGKSSVKNNPYNQMTQPDEYEDWENGFEDGINHTNDRYMEQCRKAFLHILFHS